jgi:hydrogenase nickel incorporation protein HypB
VPEGHDKPYKYPGMFATADIILLNKWDMAGPFEFDAAAFERGVRLVNPTAPIVRVSCRTGEGLAAWLAQLTARLPVGVPDAP